MESKSYKIFTGVLSACLAFIFISFGIIKLTPYVSREVHKQVYREFVKYSQVHPAVMFGYQIDPKKFMPQIGAIEVVCGTLMVIGPRIAKVLSCLVLSSVLVGGMYFIFMLGQPLQYLIGFAVLLLLLLVRVNMLTTQPAADVVVTHKEVETKKKKKIAKKID